MPCTAVSVALPLKNGEYARREGLVLISHCAPGELPLIFGTHAQYRGNSTEFEWEVSEVMQGESYRLPVSANPPSRISPCTEFPG